MRKKQNKIISMLLPVVVAQRSASRKETRNPASTGTDSEQRTPQRVGGCAAGIVSLRAHSPLAEDAEDHNSNVIACQSSYPDPPSTAHARWRPTALRAILA